MLLVAGCVGVALFVGVGAMLYRIRSIDHGNGRRGAPAVNQPTSTAPALSGTKALDVTPVEGVRITAPANALDKSRSFTVTRIADADLPSRVGKLIPDTLPVAAFHVDSGLKRGEKFPGPVTIRFDLRKLGIPEGTWGGLSVVRLEENGSRSELIPSVKDGELRCATRKNSDFILAVSLLTVGPPLLMKAYTDNTAKFNYLGETGFKDHISNYTLYWSGALGIKDQAECLRVNGILHAMYQKYGFEAKDGQRLALTGFACANAYSAMIKDPQYAEAFALATDPAWKKKFFWPDRVAVAANSLLKADEYLMQVRKFKRPEACFDVLVLANWPANFTPKAPGLCESPQFQDSYLAVNVSDDMFGSDKVVMTPGGRLYKSTHNEKPEKIKDGMNITVVHELFHALQDAYITVRYNAYLLFFEATAVTLEYEADAHYVKEKWNTDHGILADRDAWETLRQPLPDPGIQGDVRKHGYTLSHFFDYLRDDPTFNRKDDFVKGVTEAFQGFLATPVSAIHAGGGATAAELSERFLAFCQDGKWAATMYDDIMNKATKARPRATEANLLADIAEPLDAAKPVSVWKFDCIRSLSVDYRIYSFPQVPAAELSRGMIYILNGQDGAFEEIKVHHDLKRDDAPFKPMTGNVAGLKGPLPSTLAIKRMDANTATPWTSSPALDVKVILMLAPKEPLLTYDEGSRTLKIEIDESALKGMLAPLGMLVSREVYLTYPGRAKPVTIQLDANTRNLDLDLARETRAGARLAGLGGDADLEVSYAECVVIPERDQMLRGPESQRLKACPRCEWKIVWGSLPPGWTVSNGSFLTDRSNAVATTGERALVDNPEFSNLLYFRYAAEPLPGYEIRAIVEISSARERDYSTQEKIEAGFRDSKGRMTPGFQGTKEVRFQGCRAIRYDVGSPTSTQKEWGYMVEIDPARNLWFSILCHVSAVYRRPTDKGVSKEEQISKRLELEKTVEGYLGKYIQIKSGPPAPSK